ncbi:MAG: ABC transporter ATP-binding protein [Pseudomonadota bacterium]|nr:ABC transporter ATP-binding protein [Pseudomonadota bacterium]
MLEIRKLSAGYGEVKVLHDVALRVKEGSITALVGSNGAGKTTLMRTISGLLHHSAGDIQFADVEIGDQPADQRVALGISLVPEGRMIFPDFTVEQNLRVGAFVTRARTRTDANLEKMFKLFPRLRERRNQHGETLSGGEQQMLALARGLMSEPTMLLLDEPSLGLAPAISQLLFETVVRVRDSGVTVFIVEQDIRSTLEIADQAYVMENGRVVLSGTGAQLLTDDSIKQAYLGI